MEIVYRTQKIDLDEPYWRLSIEYSQFEKKIIVKITNYTYGFISGEEFEKIFTHDKHTCKVSFMTKKSYEHAMDKYDELVGYFLSKVRKMEEDSVKEYQSMFNLHKSFMQQMSDIKSSDIFTNIYREQKLKNILK